MNERTRPAAKGLVESLTSLVASLVAMGYTRLELLSTEVEEAGAHWLSLVCLALTALFCLGVGVVLVSLLVIAMFWDQHRLLALGVLASGYLLTGIAICGYALYRARLKPKLFVTSLSSLAADRHQLLTRS